MLVSIALFASLLGSCCASKPLPRSLTDSGSKETSSGSTENIAFDVADLTHTMKTAHEVYQLEAYRSTWNDAILKAGGGNRTSELHWVSIGKPEFIRSPDVNNPEVTRLFHPTRYGFTAYIEMMTDEQRQILVATANEKYGVNITANQIVNLILATFQCTLTMYDEFNNIYLLKGIVSNFRSFPLRMDFDARPGSAERKLFSGIINDTAAMGYLSFACTMASRGKLPSINTLSITSDKQQHTDLDEKLFGKADNSSGTVFVTRDQTSMLASSMYSSLQIYEDYDMPQYAFSEAFVDGLIRQLATDNFKQVDVDTVLGAISKYGFDISGDIKPDIIKKNAGSILKIEQYNNKSRIVLDQGSYNQFINSQSSSAGYSGGACYVAMCASAAHDYAESNGQKSSSYDRTLTDQLNELNSASRNEAQWDIEGTKIVPKSFNVARLRRSKLGSTITFSRVRIQTIDAPFKAAKSINVRRPSDTDAFVDKLSSRIDQMQADISQQLVNIKKRTVIDCGDIRDNGETTSGVYTLYNGQHVYCDMTTDGGGWTVFQRRQDGREEFYKKWADYANGFGNITREFWLGNDKLAALTRNRRYKLRVDLADFSGNSRHAEYSNFRLGSVEKKYKLISLGTYSGNAGDSLTYHVGSNFSTSDQDNNAASPSSAVKYKGAWWYTDSLQSNLNGKYYNGTDAQQHTSTDGLEWSEWTGLYYSLRFTEMKIRPNTDEDAPTNNNCDKEKRVGASR